METEGHEKEKSPAQGRGVFGEGSASLRYCALVPMRRDLAWGRWGLGLSLMRTSERLE